MDSTLWSSTPLVPRPSGNDTGAFAAEDLQEGTIVVPSWHEAFYDGMEGWVRLDRRQVRQLPRDAKKLFLRYGLDQDFDQIIGPVDIRYVTTPDNFINHSCDPNLRYDVAGNVVAARSIAKGEEVFIDYGCSSSISMSRSIATAGRRTAAAASGGRTGKSLPQPTA